MKPMNPKVISVHDCMFLLMDYVLALSREVRTVLGLVHHTHKVSSSGRLPLNGVGSQGRISMCWMKQGALGRGNRQEGPANLLGWPRRWLTFVPWVCLLDSFKSETLG